MEAIVPAIAEIDGSVWMLRIALASASWWLGEVAYI